MKGIVTILHFIYKQKNLVEEHEYIVTELMKLIQELLKSTDDLSTKAVNHILAILTLFITDDSKKKKNHHDIVNDIL